ncbi:GumC family protein [Chelativorans sp. EGI FJ00035]|uniref:GumC family protein n=2 Tax=Chelativorans salis TaxID=2978478 RepID=A0ABT2LS97_9HYPH|nr:GumC family protein [Chelativorans sp. EGI FJ00035]MCT7376263.1 GumC family protein [Chelativorans sp. EGI FJ00035]
MFAAAAEDQAKAERAEPSAQVVAPAPSTRFSVSDRLERLRDLSPDDIISWIDQGKVLIASITFVCVAIALVYALTATPRYTAYTDIVVDPANLQVVNDDVFANNQQRDTQLLEVESKLRVLTSRNVLERVIDKMNLTEDPEFVKPSLFDPLRRMISGTPTTADHNLGVLRALSERVTAQREERSYVVVLSVWTEDPLKSVELSNAIVDAFEAELFEAASLSAGRVVASISERLDELRANVSEAEARVEEFKRNNGLQSNGEELVSERRSTELDEQLLRAQERQIQLEMRYNQLNRALEERRSATLPAFQSEALIELRAQYDRLQQQLQALSLTYLDRHPRLQTIRTEITAVGRAIETEARRIVDAARIDAEQAQSVVEELRQKGLAEQAEVYNDNSALVMLRELTRDARAKAALYETFLSRSQEITERQQINTSNIRVISHAAPPKSRSWPPRTIIILAAGVFIGLLLGLGAALLLGLFRYSSQPQAAAR